MSVWICKKSTYRNFKCVLTIWPFEANAKQLKVATVRDLGLKNDNLIAVIRRKIALGKSAKILQWSKLHLKSTELWPFMLWKEAYCKIPAKKRPNNHFPWTQNWFTTKKWPKLNNNASVFMLGTKYSCTINFTTYLNSVCQQLHEITQ